LRCKSTFDIATHSHHKTGTIPDARKDSRAPIPPRYTPPVRRILSVIWYWFIIVVVKNGFYRLTGGIKSYGSKNVPRIGPVLIAPNHVSNLDPPATAVMCPRMLRFMAKEELFHPKIVGKAIASVGAFPVRRGEGDTEAIRFAISCLQEGEAVLVFPEGTRGDGVTLGEVNKGVSVFAKRSGAAVVPVALIGTAQKWPRGSKKPKWGKVIVAFGEPFTYADTATCETEKENREAFSAEWQRQILELCNRHGMPLKAAE
jgi:1-acyl-sn-glycerol-3-phosphate acyltransferase